MGFFKNLFEKKVCDICGEEIGLLGNRKLEDGNCCKNCAKKLSPWFTERKHSTVDEIKKQLESRENNKKAVAAFNVTRSYGKRMTVYIDEDARKFMVTAEKDFETSNPDVLDFSMITACDTDIRESKNEVYKQVRDSEGNTKKESYTPRRFRYSYDFMLKITVNHPYIDEMTVDLSSGYIDINTGSMGTVNPPSQEEKRRNDDYARCEEWSREIRLILLSRKSEKAETEDEFEKILIEYENAEREYKSAQMSGDGDREFSAMNSRIKAMQKMDAAVRADETGKLKIRALEVMERCKKQAPEAPSEPSTAKSTVCPYCGTETNGTKFCENCGHKLI